LRTASITADTARRLARLFNMSAQFWSGSKPMGTFTPRLNATLRLALCPFRASFAPQLAATRSNSRRLAAGGQLIDPLGVGLAPATACARLRSIAPLLGELWRDPAEAPRPCSGRRRIGSSPT
jgi:hypothetical protein